MSTTTALYKKLLDRANEIYAAKRIPASSLPYTAPELIPRIESRQALSVLEAVAEELEYRKSLDQLTEQ